MILYLNPIGGISGDMFAGALLDLGISIHYLRRELKKIPLSGYQIRLLTVKRAGIAAKKFSVIIEQKRNFSFNAICRIVKKSPLAPGIKARIAKIYQHLEKAERKAHGIRKPDVTFEQLGDIDSIIDIAACAICAEKLEISDIICAPLPISPKVGSATSELIINRVVRFVNRSYETVTPTGGAIISALASAQSVYSPELLVKKVGYGAGDFNPPGEENVLRAALCEGGVDPADPDIVCVETNIDDSSPQVYDYLFERLLESGAKDVFLTPAQMKKNRPGILLTVIAEKSGLNTIAGIIFEETTTLGLRYYPARRRELARETKQISTNFGNIGFKVARLNKKVINVSPEYDDCKRIARARGIPLKRIWRAAQVQAEERLADFNSKE